MFVNIFYYSDGYNQRRVSEFKLVRETILRKPASHTYWIVIYLYRLHYYWEIEILSYVVGTLQHSTRKEGPILSWIL
jgi:hypothetical protein